MLPLLLAYLAYELIAYAVGAEGALDFPGVGVSRILWVELGVDVALLIVMSALFLLALRRTVTGVSSLAHMRLPRSSDREATVDATVDDIRDRLERGEPPPLDGDPDGIAVFVSGHTTRRR